jgi:hypothetical protein
MNITPAAGTGKLTGTVSGLERCDARRLRPGRRVRATSTV